MTRDDIRALPDYQLKAYLTGLENDIYEYDCYSTHDLRLFDALQREAGRRGWEVLY